MRLIVRQGNDEQSMEVPEGSSSLDILDRLSLLPDAYIVLRGRTPVPVDEVLNDGESIRLIKVASGG